jgi:lambda family phage portal protein
MNGFDKLISWFSPTAGAKRAQARLALDSFRDYEGAARGRRTANWKASASSATAEVQNGGETLRHRARDLARNNPYASKAASVIVSNVIGFGIRGQIKARSKARADAVQQSWSQWADSTQCDAQNRHDFYGLQQLIMRTVVESGECLVIKEIRSGQAIPICLRVVEPDHLDKSRDGDANAATGNRIIDGIELDSGGRAVAYWIFPEHPGDRTRFYGSYQASVRIPAENVSHIFRMDRPGMVRGVPWCHSVMIRLRDLDEYEDAQLVRQKIAACFTAFVTDMDSNAGLGNQQVLSERLEPGTIEILPPGRGIQMATPPAATGYTEYMRTVLHSIAAGFGITYESLTGDLSQVNFSSARMGWLEFQRNLDAWRWSMFIPQFCASAFNWFTQGFELAGGDADGMSVEWTAPRREMIDPQKEVAAMRDAIRCGFCTLSEAQRMLGYDPTKLMTEYKADLNSLDRLEIKLDTDPRHMTAQGQAQSVNEPAAPVDNSADRALDDVLVSLARSLNG